MPPILDHGSGRVKVLYCTKTIFFHQLIFDGASILFLLNIDPVFFPFSSVDKPLMTPTYWHSLICATLSAGLTLLRRQAFMVFECGNQFLPASDFQHCAIFNMHGRRRTTQKQGCGERRLSQMETLFSLDLNRLS